MQNHQKLALISVYEKKGIEDFARELVSLGWKIISSGGTAKHLSDAGISVTDVAEITGMSPILGHRVATLDPKIHGGLLALETPEHLAELEKYGIPWIDMVCVDFYPLKEEISNPSSTLASVIEKTDIGGPTMARSAGKGGRIVVCNPADRQKVIEWLKTGEPEREEFLNALAAKAEAVVANYCSWSADYRGHGLYKMIAGEKSADCLYGENAYQKPASLYKNPDINDPLAISQWSLVGGTAMSYNNICDLDRMIQTMTHIGAGFEKNFSSVPFIALGVKHGNACGVGISENEKTEAIEKMLIGDLRAIFGGLVMLNFPVDEKIAEELLHNHVGENRRLLDIVAALSFSDEAVEMLSRKKGKCRLIANPAIEKAGLSSLDTAGRFRYVRGGFLSQPNYTFVPDLKNKDALLAWAVGSTSNSNTITLTKDGRLVGNGVGQQDRVGAAKLAIFRADESAKSVALSGQSAEQETTRQDLATRATRQDLVEADLVGAAAYSDSFFPFPDAVEALIGRGIKTIFSTSGSVNDNVIIELCKSKGIDLVLVPDPEARGFYQH